MTARREERGFTALETLVATAILLVAMTGVAGMLLHSSRMNKSQQLATATQSDARTSMTMILGKLRSAGWDPTSAGIQVVQLDSNPGDGIDEIEAFADLDADGDTDGPDEQVLIRHIADRIEWRRSAGGSFEILAVDMSNDSDGDGTPEPMFVPDSTTDPTRVVVQVTAESAEPDPVTHAPIRVTLASEVVFRKKL
jgi:prepilin-type N-terminal cleavage/methylation domain-containing protein